ncbi:hypothetical protein JCGZ_23794 [Jatropha curcas]|uniref:Gem-associated protein 2 n=1 Tax=Jatropha curcas TaxID=180498 RepID=A0A067L365_JATCU|nr:hypothetical protein JCGZ_23794 [Jatropha curcas]
MADDIESDACIDSKSRITEMEETLFPQHQESLDSISTVSTQESAKESSLIDSSTKEDIPSLSSSKKVKCSFTEPSGSSEENQGILGSDGEEKVILCDLVSGSLGSEGKSEDFVRKIESFDVELQETKNCEMGFDTDVKNRQENIEGTVKDVVGEKEKELVCVKSEMGFSVAEKFDKHGVAIGSFIEEKKEEEQSLLEAKKKQLLTKIETGSIFKDKILGGLEGIDEPIRRSLKVKVIDDTAVLEAVPIPKTGNGENKKQKQEVDGKKLKLPRRKGKDVKNVSETSEKQKKTTQVGKAVNKLSLVGEAQNESQKNGHPLRKYSREEMEALRFVNVVEQRKLWRDTYTGLGDAVVKEYDDLAGSRHHKNIHLNFDPRQHYGKKEDARRTLREVSSENVCDLDSASNESIGSEEVNASLEAACSEEEDSDEDYASVQRPAFLVEGEPDFDSGPPEDGWEYLRRVRWEAAHIPKVTVAKLDRSKGSKEQSVYMPQIPEIAKCPEHLMPLKQWEEAFLADFSELRMVLSGNEGSCTELSYRMQHVAITHEQNNSSPQLAECVVLQKFNLISDDVNHANDQPSSSNAEDGKISACSQNLSSKNSVSDDSTCNYPTLSAIFGMDSVTRVLMLKKCIGLAETRSSLSKNDCMWLFALCVAVDTPLHADTSAALRSLLRKCASLRAAKSELDDEVIMLNILATISGRYFGQSES